MTTIKIGSITNTTDPTLADANGAPVSATPINGTFMVRTGVKDDPNSDGKTTPTDAAIALELAASGNGTRMQT